MGTLRQDYKDWKKAKAEAEYCVNAMDTFQQSIEVKLPYEEWCRNFEKIETFCKMMEAYKEYANDPKTHSKFMERYDVLAKLLRSSTCFMGCRSPFSAYPWSKFFGEDLKDTTLRCINNRDNGEITEHLCDGCGKFKELVKYQMLAANAKSALERQNVAKMMLANHFRIFKIK
ncbi:MAG: hypothetical protein J5679_00190 [Alphaproteobacteria bacterium]|nr:hypothetical protein [Alphaproteobacteria bacterium]